MPVAAVLILQIYKKISGRGFSDLDSLKSEKSAGQTRGVREVAPKANEISCTRVAGLSPAESERQQQRKKVKRENKQEKKKGNKHNNNKLPRLPTESPELLSCTLATHALRLRRCQQHPHSHPHPHLHWQQRQRQGQQQPQWSCQNCPTRRTRRIRRRLTRASLWAIWIHFNAPKRTWNACSRSMVDWQVSSSYNSPLPLVHMLTKSCLSSASIPLGISMHKGYAFVQFTNPFDARNACHGEDGKTVLSQTLGESYLRVYIRGNCV